MRTVGRIALRHATTIVPHAALIVGLLFSATAWAEVRPEKLSGKIIAVGPEGIRAAGASHPILIVISDAKLTAIKKEKTLSVSVIGTAETNYLAKDQAVSFSAELAGGRKGTGEVDELVLFTVDATHPLEAIDTSPSLDEGKSAAERTSSYSISGQIQSFRDGYLSVMAPNERGKMYPIKVRVSDKATVRVQASDFGMARPGDAIEAEGYTDEPAGLLTTIVAEKVTITATKPFVNSKRAKTLAASKANAERQLRRARTNKSAAEVSDADSSEPTPAPVAAATSHEVADAREEPADATPQRRKGDPPVEGIILVDDFSVDEKTPVGSGGITALHVAARHGQTAAVALLLKAGAKPDAYSKSKVTPLMVAAWQGQLAIVKALLQKGAQVSATDREGQTPLMYAAAGGNAEVVQLLLEHNAQPTDKSKRGTMALSVALEGKVPAVIAKLRQAVKESAPALDF